jgi:predicted nucleic-acid-binding protein
MTKISLLIDDEYIEEFIQSLPKEKVLVIEHNFEENKKLLADALEEYRQNQGDFVPYYESMKNISSWFQTKGFE